MLVELLLIQSVVMFLLLMRVERYSKQIAQVHTLRDQVNVSLEIGEIGFLTS
jgi:hypothetical protein